MKIDGQRRMGRDVGTFDLHYPNSSRHAKMRDEEGGEDEFEQQLIDQYFK